MAQLPDGSMKELFTGDDLLKACLDGNPIFREGDIVEVKNVSLPGQPLGRFRITMFKNDDMVLMGVPRK